jgi:diacylglycerol kinase family enzyme
LKGTQASQKEIQIVRGARIVIEAVEGVLPAHADGEIISHDGRRLEIELLPHALEVVSAAAGSRP